MIYEIQLWGAGGDWNIKFLKIFQSAILCMLIGVLWYVINIFLHQDLKMHTTKKKLNESIQTTNNNEKATQTTLPSVY